MRPLDHAFLLRTLHLANQATHLHFPNPTVGALIVHDDRIIGEGCHEVYGQAHAEVQAVSQVENKALLATSTLYVSLEPCSYHGNTPACTDLVICYNIPRVVVGCLDPNPKVAGSGIDRLREAGVEVHLAPDPKPFETALSWFFVNHRLQRPYVTLKWAETNDGFIGGINEAGQAFPVTITGLAANMFSHRLRAFHQAILVGRVTAQVDNPQLTNRLALGDSPFRLVWDPDHKLPQSHSLFQGNRPTFRVAKTQEYPNDWVFQKSEKGGEVAQFLSWLYNKKKVTSLLVEGGTQTLQGFLDEKQYDQIVNYLGAQNLQKGVMAPQKTAFVKAARRMNLGDDKLNYFTNT